MDAGCGFWFLGLGSLQETPETLLDGSGDMGIGIRDRVLSWLWLTDHAGTGNWDQSFGLCRKL